MILPENASDALPVKMAMACTSSPQRKLVYLPYEAGNSMLDEFSTSLQRILTQPSANHQPSMICVFVRTTALMIVRESSSMMMSVQRHSTREARLKIHST